MCHATEATTVSPTMLWIVVSAERGQRLRKVMLLIHARLLSKSLLPLLNGVLVLSVHATPASEATRQGERLLFFPVSL